MKRFKTFLIALFLFITATSYALSIITVYETRNGVRYKVTYVGGIEVRRTPA